MPHPSDDPIRDAVGETLAPLVGVLPADLFEAQHEILYLNLAAHPLVQDAVRRLAARPLAGPNGQLESGQQGTSSLDAPEAPAETPRARGAR